MLPHVDDGSVSVPHVTAEQVSGQVPHLVVVRGQEDVTAVLHVPVQETPQFRQVRHVPLDNEIISKVLAFPDYYGRRSRRTCVFGLGSRRC